MGKNETTKGKLGVSTEADTLAKWDEMLDAEFGASSMAAESSRIRKEMRECIDLDNKAKTALEALKKAGCNEDRILKAIYQYCGGDPAEDKKAKEDHRRYNETIIETAKRLGRLAERIEKCMKDLKGCGIDWYPRAPEDLRQFALMLDKCIPPYRELASGRVSGRDAYLSELVEMVKNITKRRHYRELADLVHATLRKYAPKSKKVIDAESLRKVVKSYRRRMSSSARKKPTND